ncbi:MAG: efflux RND transporter permease subunit, partial [Terriglobales bacterium]
SSTGGSLVVVRFEVGRDVQRSLTEVYTKLYAHLDALPAGAPPPVVKLRSIYDVPVLALTLSGPGYDDDTLRRIAEELNQEVKRVPNVSHTEILGGRQHQWRVEMQTARLQAFHVTPTAIAAAISAANQRQAVGELHPPNQDAEVYAGQHLASAADLAQVVVGVSQGQPVLLQQVAQVLDAPAEATQYVRLSTGAGAAATGTPSRAAAPLLFAPAVTLSVAKREGANAVQVVDSVLRRVNSLRQTMLPAGVHLTITRNYGQTAQQRSNELLFHMLLATGSVILLVAVVLGWRESGVVAIAIPLTLLLTLFLFYIYGYTLNRITLFALIFSIGILVDDAIVVVENIVRHFRLPESQGRPRAQVAVEAVAEVGNPTILATLTVIAALLPMAFVGGLMGPYMRPIPVGASAAMVFSLLIAFAISPWAATRILAKQSSPQPAAHGSSSEDWATRQYRRIMPSLRASRVRQFLFFGGIGVLLLAALSLIWFRVVLLKMLPFDNKDEFEVVLQMPDGTPLEQTAAVAQRLSDYLGQQAEVRDITSYVGTPGPYNFNGLVRHYFLRRRPNQADLQIDLVDTSARRRQSHALAVQLRPELARIAAADGGRITVAEIPPGPPDLQTLVAEVYGPSRRGEAQLAQEVAATLRRTPGVVDVDTSLRDAQAMDTIAVDEKKAALSGVSVAQVVAALQLALHGQAVDVAHLPEQREEVPIWLQLTRTDRTRMDELLSLPLTAADGHTVPLSELTVVQRGQIDPDLVHKDLRPVVYVLGDVAGAEESPAYAVLALNPKLRRLRSPSGLPPTLLLNAPPKSTEAYTIKWDGEWQTTLNVFRDLGVAFAAALVLIYVLVVSWFRSYRTPWVILAPIPLTLIGILPAHALLGAYFTATSMIGFIAGAGIIVRNSIILVDFIELRRAQGMPLAEAVVDAGAVRFRPMLLTAAAVMVGSSVMLKDPIFQGLAISLLAGEVASTLLSRIAVPVLYYLSAAERDTALAPVRA